MQYSSCTYIERSSHTNTRSHPAPVMRTTYEPSRAKKSTLQSWWALRDYPPPSPGMVRLCPRLWEAWVISLIAGSYLLLDIHVLAYVGYVYHLYDRSRKGSLCFCLVNGSVYLQGYRSKYKYRQQFAPIVMTPYEGRSCPRGHHQDSN